MPLPSPLVSVLLPCYNAAPTLEEALHSLQAQTLEEHEVILVDDGSNDASLPILEAFAAADRRFRLIRQEHGGIVAALNTGLAACRAPLVARMDADDRAYPERLRLQREYLLAHPEVAIAGCLVSGLRVQAPGEGFRIYLEWLNSLVTDEEIRRDIFVESPIAHPSAMFHRAAVSGYEEHGWAEDYDLWLRLYLEGKRFGKVPQVLLEWRDDPQRLTRTDSRYSLENFLRLKAHYLKQGPLADRETVFVWGAGMMGRRLGKQLQRVGVPLAAYFDVDPKKIGGVRRGRPIYGPEALPRWWEASPRPVVLAAVGARGARSIIRQRLEGMGLHEGSDWWCVA